MREANRYPCLVGLKMATGLKSQIIIEPEGYEWVLTALISHFESWRFFFFSCCWDYSKWYDSFATEFLNTDPWIGFFGRLLIP